MKKRRLAVLLSGLVALGFSGALPTHAETTRRNDDEAEPLAALAAVNEYLSAVEAKSCPRLMAISSWLHSEEACENELGEFAHHHARFVKVARLVKDGRDTGAWLATMRLSKDGHERDILLRIENRGRGWKIQS
jgi:hypothetical protein